MNPRIEWHSVTTCQTRLVAVVQQWGVKSMLTLLQKVKEKNVLMENKRPIVKIVGAAIFALIVSEKINAGSVGAIAIASMAG